MRAWWLVALCACSRSATERPPDCEKAITAASLRIVAESKRVGLAVDAERARLTMIASCEDERWNADVMHCIETARLEIDLSTCTERLTHEQYERLQRKLAAVRGQMAMVIDAGGVVVAVDAAPVDAAVDASVVVDAEPVAVDAMVPADAAVRRPPPRASIASPGFAGARSTPEGSAESIASPGFAGARSTPEGSAESIDAAPAEPGCQKAIVDPRNRNCIRQYCRGHPDDIKCQIDE